MKADRAQDLSSNIPNNIIPFPNERPKVSRKQYILKPGEDPFEAADKIAEQQKKVDSFDSVDEVNKMVAYFLERKRFRDACLLVLGCNTGFRISDLLDFRWNSILSPDGHIRESRRKVERKTGKPREFYCNQAICEALKLYKNDLMKRRPFCLSEPLFISEGPRVGYIDQDSIRHSTPQAINKRSAARIIREAAKELNLYRPDRRISTHSMRQTFADEPQDLVEGIDMPLEFRMLNSNIGVSSLMLNHAKIQTTADHYSSRQRKIGKKLANWMNLGLEAIQEYKLKHGEE